MAKQQFSIRDCASIFGNTVIGGSSLTEGASARLHVKSAASEGANLSNTSGLLIETGGTCSTCHALTIATCCGTVFNVTDEGKVGIGITTPGVSLTVSGALSSSTGYCSISSDNTLLVVIL